MGGDDMQKIYFEEVNKAHGSYPYIEFDIENIQYVSHYHQEVEICRVVSGEVQIRLENRIFLAPEGGICIFMPGEVHSFSSEGASCVNIMKLPSKNEGDLSLKNLRLEQSVVLPGHKHYKEILRTVKNTEKEHKNKKAGYTFAVKKNVNRIFELIIRALPNIHIATEQQKKLAQRQAFLNEAETYLRANYEKRITLEEVARYCGYSKFYFSHMLKDIAGETFLSYLSKYRLERSAELLALTQDSIIDIAHSCGFGSQRSFNREFKRYYQTTPSEYRAR